LECGHINHLIKGNIRLARHRKLGEDGTFDAIYGRGSWAGKLNTSKRIDTKNLAKACWWNYLNL